MKLRLTGFFAWLWICTVVATFLAMFGIVQPLLFMCSMCGSFVVVYGAQQIWRAIFLT